MSENRIEIFRQMLASDPINTSILFGLAKEYEKAGMDTELIETLSRYIDISDDEGNAFGMLARAYERTGQRDKAKQTYERGIDAASSHGHPSMAEEYRMTLSSDYED
jgi:predicted Zn-dependent protease